MTLRAGWAVLLAFVVAAGCAGCGGSGSAAASRVSPTYQVPASPSGDAVPGTAAALGELAHGRCPARPPVPALLSSALDRVKAATMVVCRYRGVNDTPALGLAGSAVIADAAAVESWRRRFLALPRVDLGKYHCPNDDGSAVLAAFPGKDTVVVVRLALRGCQFVTIGRDDTRATTGSGSLRTDLPRLVP
jgi:hypothetical protein